MMKKRRTIIISFLLLATLIMGVGYAALADQLTIGGRASYKPSSAVANEIASAIYFDTTHTSPDRHGDNENVIPTLSAGFSAGLAKPNSATMSVAFNGVENRTDYEASMEFKIVYEASDTLPDVTMNVTALEIMDGGVAVAGFATPTVELYTFTDEANRTGKTIIDTTTHVTPGTNVYALVTVEYNYPTVNPPTALVAGTIDITIHCNTVN